MNRRSFLMGIPAVVAVLAISKKDQELTQEITEELLEDEDDYTLAIEDINCDHDYVDAGTIESKHLPGVIYKNYMCSKCLSWKVTVENPKYINL